MKNAIRILSLLLVLVMCVGVFAACGSTEDETIGDGTNTPGTNKPAPDGTNSLTDRDWKTDLEHGLPKGLNFGNATIKFLVCDGDEATADLPSRSIWIDPNDSEALAFEVNSKVHDRNTRVEKELGVKIVMDVCQQGETSSKIAPTLASKIHEYDVVGAYQYYDMGLTIGENAGFFVNYKSEDYADDILINVNKGYWDKDLYETLSYGDVAYWVTGDLAQTWVASVFVSFVNGDLWTTYADTIAALPGAQGISDPFELVEKGLWTMDLWMEISKKVWVDKNNNEKVDIGDTAGFLGYKPSMNNIMADGLAAGAGVTYSTDKTGDWTMDFANGKNTLFATKLYQLYNESNACLLDFSDKYLMEEFADGNYLMTVNLLHMSEYYLADMNNFLVLPVPKLLATDEYTTTTHDNVTLFGIPKTTIGEGKLRATTATLEAMACYSYNDVTEAYYIKTLQTRFNRANEAQWEKQSDMINTIRGSVYHDFAALYADLVGNKAGGGAITHFFRTDCGNRNFAQSVASKNSSWNTGLTKVLEDIASSYYID